MVDFDWIMTIFDFLAKLKIRKYMLVLMVVMTTLSYLRIRYTRKKITKEEEDALIEATYAKDEEGRYPWEVDTNDHPSRVTKDSRRISNSWGPKKGQW